MSANPTDAPITHAAVAEVARRLGLTPPPAPPPRITVDSATNTVFRLGDHAVRMRNGLDSAGRLGWEVSVARRLHARGVAFAQPAPISQPIIVGPDQVATVWRWYAPSGLPVDWHGAGMALRAMHDAGDVLTAARSEHLVDLETVWPRTSLEASATTGRVRGVELADLASRLDLVEEQYLAMPTLGGHPVLAHGDFAERNLIQTAAGVLMFDPDCIGRARFTWDLASLLCDAGRGQLSLANLVRFSDGYGRDREWPSYDQAVAVEAIRTMAYAAGRIASRPEGMPGPGVDWGWDGCAPATPPPDLADLLRGWSGSTGTIRPCPTPSTNSSAPPT